MTEALLKTPDEELTDALLAGEDYDAEKFKKLSDRDHVRLRYGMYIGDSSVQGLHHLVYELVNNSIDEVMATFAKKIWVTINNDGSATVEVECSGKLQPSHFLSEGSAKRCIDRIFKNLIAEIVAKPATEKDTSP